MTAVPSTFDPVDDCPVTPYCAWIVDDLIGTVSNGANVSSVPNRGSNGRPLVRSSAPLQPVFQATDANFNGHASLLFASKSMQQIYGENLATSTIVVIGRLTSNGAGTNQVLIDGLGVSNRHSIYRRAASNDWSIYAGTAQHAGTPDTNAHCFVAKFIATASSNLTIDGASVVTGNAGTQAMQGISVGADYTVTADYAACEIAAVLVFSGDVTGNAGWQTYIGNLASHYGIWFDDTDTVSGNAVRLQGPIGTGTHPLMIYCHGYGHDQDRLWSETRLDDYREGLLSNGWIVAGSDQDGDNWGNADGQAAITELLDWVEDTYTVSKILLVGTSMGVAGALNWVASTARDPRTRGVVTIAGVVDLEAMFLAGTYTSSIVTAYGIAAGLTDYLSKTAGFDPELHTAESYGGLRFLLISSDADPDVPGTEHADDLAALVADTARSVDSIKVTGGHVSDAHYEQDDEFADFAATLLADEPPELVIQAIGLAGTTVTFEKADPNGDRVAAGDTVELAVANASGSSITVTIDSYIHSDQGTDEDVGGTVANGATKWFGPFPANRFANPDGYVEVSYSAAVGVTVAATRV